MSAPRPRHAAAHSLLNTNANLLVALDALLQTRSVTAAAGVMGVNQSSMSGTLRQLREIFGDPILVRASRSMQPTPLALKLAPSVRKSMELLEQVLSGSTFDPSTSRERFVVAMGDRSAPVIVPRLLATLRRLAPTVTLQVVNWNRIEPPPGLAEGELDVSVGVIAPKGVERWAAVSLSHASAHHSEALYDSGLASVVRAGHPTAGHRLTLAKFCRLQHVLVTEQAQGRGIIDDALAEIGKSRTVVARVPTHALALALVASTDLVATIDRRIAEHEATARNVRVFNTPVALPMGQIGMAWHDRTHADVARSWLRQQIRDAAAAA